MSSEELLKDFGPNSPVAGEVIKVFYEKLSNPKQPRTRTLFDDWRRVFSQVCAYKPEKVKGLERVYGVANVDPEMLLFALHTYYALIMKLIAAEIATRYISPMLWPYLKSYLEDLEVAYHEGGEGLRRKLEDLENGGVFARLGIVNFMEADYFSWYLNEWDERVAKCIMDIVGRLSNYDMAVAEFNPERVRDLFKRLYQNLVPRDVRHDLGEYYTPDWLAELLLNEVGWTLETFEEVARKSGDPLAPLNLRLLDPACGSGTFLILAISRLRRYVGEHRVKIDVREALRRITRNIVGFDLNPLAVITARTNYLIALGSMLREKGPEVIEIPVYLADSLVDDQNTLVGRVYVLKTVVDKEGFRIPASVVERGLLAHVLKVMEECVEGGYSLDEFKRRLSEEVDLSEGELLILAELFKKLLELEREGKNRVWVRVLRNAFAPIFVGKFNYVVGNPPWVGWENLGEEFRGRVKELYKKYGILPKNPNAQTKVDLSMVFAYHCMHRYLADGGIFGFLINDAAFKAMAGSGFRKFNIRGVPFKVNVVHDLVEIKPFEGASNRPTMFVAKKGKKTEYPIPYKKWCKRVKGEIPQNLALNEVLSRVEIRDLHAKPLHEDSEEVPPLLALPSKDLHDKLKKIIGRSMYEAHGGPDLYPAGVYRIRLIEKHQSYSRVENLVEQDKKFKVEGYTGWVENDLIYPIVLSGDVNRWSVKQRFHAIIPHDSSARVYAESELKIKYPKAYSYLFRFKDALTKRSDYRKYGADKPFYFVYKLSTSAFSKYKVVWRNMGNRLDAAVVTPVSDDYLGSKPLIPEHTITFIPVGSENEAHYICSILNSSLVNLILQSIAKGGKNFASPELVNTINIRRYDPSNQLHVRLAELSRKAHELAKQGRKDELAKVEEEVDRLVAQLYGITEEELEEIKEYLAKLAKHENKEGD